MNLLDRAVAGVVPRLPRAAVGRVARRYIAGESLEEALGAARALNTRHMSVTLDVLGENITGVDDAAATVALYRRVVEQLHTGGVDGNISVKLTHLGLNLDVARCEANVEELVEAAGRVGMFVRIDMEDSSVTSETLGIFRRVRERHENVGIVLQSYMRRSEQDALDLAALGARVRICKGIYREPAEVAFQHPEEIRAGFLRVLEILLDRECHVAIATHDEAVVEGAYRLLERQGGVAGRYEFQMLLGVRERLRDSIVAAGHPMRVYVPFGEHWYAYSVRRLRENPAIAGHILRSMFRMD